MGDGMKIEVGQWYRLRNGQIGYVFGKMLSTDATYPVRLEIAGGASFAHTNDGCHYEGKRDSQYDIIEHLPDCDSFTWVKPKPKPVYRPFASAAEFAPHRDKWIQRFYGDGCFRVIAYDETSVYTRDGESRYTTYFTNGFTFEDGTPFGVLENKE